MYYIANTTEAQLKHIATKDMIVYQVGELYKNKYFLSCFNTIYTEDGSLGRKQFIPHILCKSITLNFDGNGKYPVKNLIIGKFLMPKDTLYYKNSIGLIVSNTLLFTGTYYEPIINGNLIETKEAYVL